jgi:NADH-quinone oxidoreductase subunit C
MSEERIAKVAATLAERFDGEVTPDNNQTVLRLPLEHLLEAVTALRDEFGFQVAEDITVVDYWQRREPRFDLVYHFFSYEHAALLAVRVAVAEGEPVPSITAVFPGANWYEREVYDMFGIPFTDHPDLRRILMPYDWEGHPLRKDFPLGYEEVQFTFNYDEIQAKKVRGRR